MRKEQHPRSWNEIKTNDSWAIFKIMGEFVNGFEKMSQIGPCVSIFGSARTKPEDKYYKLAESVAKGIVEAGYGVITGGGPGIMEAANKGAKKAGGYSVGLNISIPFEQYVNKFVTPDLSFEFHYFFMRKFWFAYLSKALIVFPGGFGTMDELFEILTLVQTAKVRKKLAVIIYDKKYWNKIMNFDALVDSGMISKSDLNSFTFCDTIDEAYDAVIKHLKKYYAKEKEPKVIEPALHLK